MELFDTLVERNVALVRIEARGTSVVTRWRVTGRNDRGIPQLGIPANGRMLDVDAITVDSVVDGAPRRFSMIDLSRVFDQIGGDGRESAAS
jgi:hypothetical protein